MIERVVNVRKLGAKILGRWGVVFASPMFWHGCLGESRLLSLHAKIIEKQDVVTSSRSGQCEVQATALGFGRATSNSKDLEV
jgi:hypothetical protein